MKKSLVILLMTGLTLSSVHAQDDDVYFIPSDEKKSSVKVKQNAMRSEYTEIQGEDYDTEYNNWADGRSSNRSIDEYNRRGNSQDSEVVPDEQTYIEDDAYDNSCTVRLVRFHSPRVAVLVSSPYYYDYYYNWYDTWYWDDWYYDYWYRPWYSWSYRPWNYYYGWGYSPWYRNSWYYGWGYYPHHHNWAWYGGGRPHGGYHYGGGLDNYHRHDRGITQRGPVGGSRSFSRDGNTNANGSTQPTRRSFAGQNDGTTTRTYGNGTSRTYGNGSQSNGRTYGNGSTTRTTTRSYGNSSDNSAGSRSYGNSSSSGSTTRSYGNSSNSSSSGRSYGNSGSSSSTRSYGGGGGGGYSGGGRSGGGSGGGRSFGR